MVSVCLACYNGSQFIIRQINSILCQLAIDDEIIVSDDNSEDNTCELIKSVGDERIKLVKNTFRPGPVGNFQNALQYAKGDFIFLSDQDDIWLPNKVSLLSAYLLNFDLVLSNCMVVDGSLNILSPSFFDLRRSSPGFWYNLYKNSYVGSCMAFRRDILAYVIPFPRHIHMHDWWIGLLVEARGKVKFVSEPQMLYVRHGANASPTGEVSDFSFLKKLKNRLFILWYVFRRLLS